MQTLRYIREQPPEIPDFKSLSLSAGNNWSDLANKATHSRPQLLKVDKGLDSSLTATRKLLSETPEPTLHSTTDVTALKSCLQKYGASDETPPKWLTLEDKVLRFYAFFRETVVESVETDHLRKVTIHFYPEDDTIMVIENKVPNSGFLGGTLLKRHRAPLSMEDRRKQAKMQSTFSGSLARIPREDPIGESHVTINDLNVGYDITLYGKTFHIVDCDDSTRTFLSQMGVLVPNPEDYPADQYISTYRKRMDSKQPIRSLTWNDRDLKMTMEQKVKGRTVSHFPEEVRRTKQFLADDGKVLMFPAVWDDRENPHGDLRFFELRYFLGDDTIEVLERMKPNCGRDPCKAFAYRRRLPKDKAADTATFSLTFSTRMNGHMSDADNERFYNPQDLRVGNTVIVYNRELVLVDADPFTRRWYNDKLGFDQPPALNVTEIFGLTQPSDQRRIPPAHNGFGTEEDSLACWRSRLMQKTNVKKVDLRWNENDGKLLRFRSKLANSSCAEDEDRRFLVTYYLADDTVQVTEQVEKNSGHIGGRIHARKRVKKYPTAEGPGSFYTWKDFYTGAIVNIAGYSFQLLSADDFTRRFKYQPESLPPGVCNENIDSMLTQMVQSNQWPLGTTSAAEIPLKDFVAYSLAYGWRAEGNGPETDIIVYMQRFIMDYHPNVTLKDFLLCIAGDPLLHLDDTILQHQDSDSLKEMKINRQRSIVAYSVLCVINDAIRKRKMSTADLFRTASTLPRTAKDITGSNPSNSFNVTINTYQLTCLCERLLKLTIDPDDMSCFLSQLFQEGKKEITLTDFLNSFQRIQSVQTLPPMGALHSSFGS